jgi:hypothetical protein
MKETSASKHLKCQNTPSVSKYLSPFSLFFLLKNDKYLVIISISSAIASHRLTGNLDEFDLAAVVSPFELLLLLVEANGCISIRLVVTKRYELSCHCDCQSIMAV